MYEEGRGVEKDLKEALKWCRKALDLGLAEAKADVERLSK